jgi:hypothetical protein
MINLPVGRSQKISASAVTAITLMRITRLWGYDPTPKGPGTATGFTRGGSIAATAFEDEVAAASREMVSAIPAPSITTNVDGRCVPVSWIVAPNSDRLQVTLCAALAAALTQSTFQPQSASRRLRRSHPARVRRRHDAAWHVCANGDRANGPANWSC